ncbi:nuclear transport factor 2 family protein [Paucibacter sp. KCTC 42545]|uniref:nuclear transport factor 2 family protein n=1 Tax=Paucibacter sp. KCTC 42545 TaxID=1768242 RepID=UPI000733C38B|nr:nuclear transport factor 2 family protein [Paucibacter sp. KCTC 42545]ALT78711.1 isomerase [Paucibacter sp. KCTC 42545]
MTSANVPTSNATANTAAIDAIVQFFETLSPAQVEQLGTIYAPNAEFKDPFNSVRGVPAIQAIFRHMFVNLESPRFVITERIVDGAQCFLAWEFRFRFKSFRRDQEQCIIGGSQLRLDEQGRITMHRDYWDAAEELYEKIPLLGGLMRWLRQRVNS